MLMHHQRNPQGPSPDIVSLKGRRFLYANETEEGRRLAEEIARKYLIEAEAAQDRPHAAHARTWLGLALSFLGKLSGAEGALERVLADWRPVFALVRGELQSSCQLALAFLKEAEATGRAVEAGVARRCLALAYYQAADFLEARFHCERALEACDPECERETQERFHDATGPIVMSVLAVTMWQLGEIGRARELIDQANRRGSELGHGPSMVHPVYWKSRLEILRGDAAAALSAAEALDGLSREHGMPFWRTEARLSAGWARGRLHDAAAGAEDLRRALADRNDQDAKNNLWFSVGLLAELEAETLGAESSLARIDEAMALARKVETRCSLPFLHLLRGKLLLERDPSNPAPAEEAFRTALAIAQEQGARSWGLRAALSLVKLYQSTARPVDTHAVLAPALEGFSPTPEMPEIAEAQSLLRSLQG
jgi:tetratricopeptide (TPR) repeat protein